jgi:hypothetical protein
MFAIKRDKDYYGIDGGFVSISKYKLIRWYPLYLAASQICAKLDEIKIEVVSSVDVLNDVLDSVANLAPEIL